MPDLDDPENGPMQSSWPVAGTKRGPMGLSHTMLGETACPRPRTKKWCIIGVTTVLPEFQKDRAEYCTVTVLAWDMCEVSKSMIYILFRRLSDSYSFA